MFSSGQSVIFALKIVKDYFQDFVDHFEKSESGSISLKIMKSDGGFSTYEKVKPSEILLSGPAGGLIGYSHMIDMFQQISGTSIDSKL